MANLAMFALASIGCALSASWQALLIFRLLQGASAGAGVVVAHAIVRDYYDGAEARKMVSIGALTYSIAPALAPIVGGYLFSGFGWRSVFWFLATLAVCECSMALIYLPETHPIQLRQPLSAKGIRSNFSEVLSQSDFMFLTIVSSLNFAAGFIYIAASTTFLTRYLGATSKGFAWVFWPLLIGNMIGSFLASKEATRPPKIMIERGFLIMASAASCNLILCTAIRPMLPWNVIHLFFYTIGMATAAPSLIFILSSRFPTLRGTASSLRWFIQNLILAVISGVVVPQISGSPISLAVTMCAVLGISLVTWFVAPNQLKGG